MFSVDKDSRAIFGVDRNKVFDVNPENGDRTLRPDIWRHEPKCVRFLRHRSQRSVHITVWVCFSGIRLLIRLYPRASLRPSWRSQRKPKATRTIGEYGAVHIRDSYFTDMTTSVGPLLSGKIPETRGHPTSKKSSKARRGHELKIANFYLRMKLLHAR